MTKVICKHCGENMTLETCITSEYRDETFYKCTNCYREAEVVEEDE